MYFKRLIEAPLKRSLFKKKVIILYGARQVGKTTLAKMILADHPDLSSTYINCDEADYRTLLSECDTSSRLREIFGNNRLIVIDEAQRVQGIGLKLKLAVDNFPDQQIIATGSSSFELSDHTSEALTGRSISFRLLPLSLTELELKNKVEANRRLESILIYGLYPEVALAPSLEEKKLLIDEISSSYLYQDVLRFQNLRNPELVRKLLVALALQAGSEVSYNELSSLLGVAKDTVAHYIDILERAFVIFRLPPFCRNLRSELGKLRKIYFDDLGVRNSLINNHNPLEMRPDVGILWENFVIAERRKQMMLPGHGGRMYFWRTYDRQEIDLVEDREGALSAFEIKWRQKAKKAPKGWTQGYPDAEWKIINRDNYFDLLGRET